MIGLDVGITNTDAVLVKNGRIEKALSSPSRRGIAEKLISSLASPGEKIAITGAYASRDAPSLSDRKLVFIDEIGAIGLGGASSAGLKRCIVASIGTGTAIVYVDGKGCEHLGGSGIGGGTITGLGRMLLDIPDSKKIAGLAKSGKPGRVDITVGDVYPEGVGTIPAHATASNFGKAGEMRVKRCDIALGILASVGETAGVLASFAAREKKTKDAVFIGAVPFLDGMPRILSRATGLFGIRAKVPECGRFSTALGASICAEYNIYIRRKH